MFMLMLKFQCLHGASSVKSFTHSWKFNCFHFLTLPHPHWEQFMMLSPMHLCPNGQAREVQSPGGEAIAACVRFLVFFVGDPG